MEKGRRQLALELSISMVDHMGYWLRARRSSTMANTHTPSLYTKGAHLPRVQWHSRWQVWCGTVEAYLEAGEGDARSAEGGVHQCTRHTTDLL